ncbi:MAG: hypothetical protein HY720_29805 [Planctomycetes bacterium]|nr:hypothetical protein [Planctomycetota bacterium]
MTPCQGEGNSPLPLFVAPTPLANQGSCQRPPPFGGALRLLPPEEVEAILARAGEPEAGADREFIEAVRVRTREIEATGNESAVRALLDLVDGELASARTAHAARVAAWNVLARMGVRRIAVAPADPAERLDLLRVEAEGSGPSVAQVLVRGYELASGEILRPARVRLAPCALPEGEALPDPVGAIETALLAPGIPEELRNKVGERIERYRRSLAGTPDLRALVRAVNLLDFHLAESPDPVLAELVKELVGHLAAAGIEEYPIVPGTPFDSLSPDCYHLRKVSRSDLPENAVVRVLQRAFRDRSAGGLLVQQATIEVNARG